MGNNQRKIFISDIHLDENHPEITQEFLDLLKKCTPKEDVLYILGDLFEAWIGDDDQTSFNLQIIQALRQATDRGLSIYFIRGNRDFLIGDAFFKATGCIDLPESEKISVFGQSILLMHGDTLCTRDVKYLQARKWLRNKTLQRLFLLLPLRIRQQIAEKMRAKSKAHTSSTAYEIMDVTHAEVMDVMEKNDIDMLIHGHTHRPMIHPLKVNGRDAERIVLSAWHDGGNALVINEQGRRFISVKEFK